MSTRNSITDFKDLRKAIEEVQKNKPAKSRYQLQAEKMNYMQEAADEKDDKKDSGLLKRKDHAGEEEIKKAYLNLGTEAQGSVEYQRGLIQKELAKMGYKTYSKFAFDSIFKFENNTMGLKESAFDDMKNIVKTKGAKKVGGVMIDMFTASVITKAYDKVNDANKKKMEKANVQTLVKLAHRIMGMKENLNLDEGKMSDLLIDIQQGATAKEIAKDFKIPLSVAKGFLQDYYGQKKGSRKEGFASDAQRRAAFASGYKEKGKKKEKKEEVEEAFSKKPKSGEEISKLMMKNKSMKGFASKVKKMKTVTASQLDKMLPDYVSGGDISKMFEELEERFNQSVPGGKRLVDFEVFLDSKDIEKALKTLSTNLKKDGFSYNKQMKNVKGSPGNFDVLINAIDEGDRWRLIVMGVEKGKNFKELDMSSSFKMIQKLPSAQFKNMFVEENLQEGTWAVPDGYEKLVQVSNILKKKIPGTKANAKKFAKDMYMLFGDDGFFDDLLKIEMEPDPSKDLRNILIFHLSDWGVTFSGYKITKAPGSWMENNESAKKRKSGNIKKSGLGSLKKFVMKANWSKEERLKEEQEHAKQSPFKLKSQHYPRAVAIDAKGFGKRHATELDITEACDSFGMITDQELQIEQIQKQLGKKGFISYTNSDLQDVFEDRETQRMIYALESIVEDQETVEYTKDQVEDSYIMSEEIEFVKPDGQKTAGPVLKVCENTFNVKDKYTGKSFTYKYIGEDNKVKSFREITEARFSAKLVKQAGGIAFDKRYVAGNMTGAVNAIEKLKKGLSDDPKVRELLRIANESFNNKFFEALTQEDQEAYVKFFKSALKKFGVNSPAELKGDKKKEFFNYIDKNYKAKDEDVKEGKYTKYSDLLLQRARAIADTNKINSVQVKKIDKLIAKEMKRLGMDHEPVSQQENINHQCATHVEHAVFGSGETVSGQHTLVQEESGEYVVTHYDVEFDHGLEEMVSVKELAVTKQESHAHAMAKKAGRKKIKANWSKKEQSRIDGRRKNFREKMIKLGYIKGR